MTMILRWSDSTYPHLFPHLIKGKGATCLSMITLRLKPRVARRSLKAVQEGCQELILVELFRFKFTV